MVDRVTADVTLFAQEAPAILGRPLSGEEVERFRRYQQLLVAWNERVNLTAITDPVEVQRRHFLDSLSCLLALPDRTCESVARAIDVGAGAGFPGLALKIVCPGWRLTLLDSVGKKTTFLRHVADELGLADVEVVTGRAEDLARSPEHRESYDLALARALASLAVLAEYCLPFVRVGGRLVAPKKADIADEEAAARGAVQKLGGKVGAGVTYRVPGVEEERLLVVVEKVGKTPPTFPRRAGLPSKKPLT